MSKSNTQIFSHQKTYFYIYSKKKKTFFYKKKPYFYKEVIIFCHTKIFNI